MINHERTLLVAGTCNGIKLDRMDLEQEIAQIKERNARVELDKAWERSWTRRLPSLNTLIAIYKSMVE